ncbi:hypothetical protein DCMF_16050 [Candidatus Formimonas warabiya]|uniref:Methyl-accepting transducer domain-containing protein n=1 Tax=Formimonas warabiya TaxID=1761012 RepID=A0A3G1L2F7_FORW1|nr:hypothetical protein DCMF_16050 [Candidatus Formimonas warabiya]
MPPEEKDPILEYFVRLAPLIQELIPLDCMIGISDREKFLYNLDGREIKNPKAIPGKPIPGESGLSKAIQKEGTVRITVSGETYGGPAFKTTTVPVRDEAGRVIGAVGLALSLSAQDALTEVAGTVATLARDASMAVEGLAESAQNLTRHHETLLSVVEEVRQQVSKTETILGFIREVAGKSNLLGLNAAIEAARAGEGGRGFSVVAEEIRKMSAYSTNSVKEIKDILVAINEKVGKMAKSISQVSDEAQNEAAATEEISASVQELATLAQKIETVAQII